MFTSVAFNEPSLAYRLIKCGGGSRNRLRLTRHYALGAAADMAGADDSAGSEPTGFPENFRSSKRREVIAKSGACGQLLVGN